MQQASIGHPNSIPLCSGGAPLLTQWLSVWHLLWRVLQVKQEWEVHASLKHPNIIQAYLGMEDSAGVRLFMEYAGG